MPSSLAAFKGFTLRPYQQELIDRTRAALKAKQALLLVVPTGGGKTPMIAELVRLAGIAGHQVVVACHRREIALQIAAAITNHTGNPPELVTAGSKPNWAAPVIVAMVPTITRRLDQLPQGGLLIADEAHHMGSPIWQKVRRRHSGCSRLTSGGSWAGMSTTPAPLESSFLVFYCSTDRAFSKDTPNVWRAGYACNADLVSICFHLSINAIRPKEGSRAALPGDLAGIIDHATAARVGQKCAFPCNTLWDGDGAGSGDLTLTGNPSCLVGG